MGEVTARTRKRFAKAVEALERAAALEALPERAERDAVLLRFELAAELMPKTLQRILSERGADVVLPKDVVRAARSANLVDEKTAEVLLAIVDDRNRMVHDYSEEFADELFARAKSAYVHTLRNMLRSIETTNV